MSTVFVVTRGEYSDYHIVAVFSTNQLANQFIDRMGKEGYFNDLEEFDLDPPFPKPGAAYFRVKMDADTGDGKVVGIDLLHGFNSDRPVAPEINVELSGKAWMLWRNVEATDPQHALKICNERRVQIIATGDLDRIRNQSKAKP